MMTTSVCWLSPVVEFDSLDSPNSPSSGQWYNINNFAYRGSLGGEQLFCLG